LLSYFGIWWTDADWQYMSEEEPYLNRHRVPLSQGKVVGGGSAINGMIHAWGSLHDCDYRQYRGNEGWGYSQVLPPVVDFPGVGQNLSDHMEGTAPDLQTISSSILFIGTEAFIGGTHFPCPQTLLRPQSRGTVSLRSNNPLDLSVVQTNWLQCDADIQVLLRGIEVVREFMNTRAFAKVGAEELMPEPE
jgi:choline dehydrogenase-like flavoprotein